MKSKFVDICSKEVHLMWRLFTLASFLLVLGFMPAAPVFAYNYYYWNTDDGYVDQTSNWLLNNAEPDVIPGTTSDLVYVNNGGTARLDGEHPFGGPIRHFYVGHSSGPGHFVQRGETITIRSCFGVGHTETSGITSTYDLNGGSIIQTNGNSCYIGCNGGKGEMTIHSGVEGSPCVFSCVSSNPFYVGWDEGDADRGTAGTLTVQDYADLGLGKLLYVAYGPGTSGTVTLEDHASLNVTKVDYASYIGRGAGADGVFEMSGDTTATLATKLYIGRDGADGDVAHGAIHLSGNAELCAGASDHWYVGYNAHSRGEITVTGSALLDMNGNDLYIGMQGGAATTIAAMDVSTGDEPGATGGTVVVNHLGIGRDSQGTVDLSEDALVTVGDYVRLGGTGGTGVLNLDGGVLECDLIRTLSGSDGSPTTGVLNFNGGVIKATGSEANFISVEDGYATQILNVKAGGAVVDTNSYDVGVNEDLVEDSESAGGGLTKRGAGTLTLGGVNTYTGDTVIQAGALSVIGSINSNVTVDADAALLGTGAVSGSVVADVGSRVAPGASIGALTIDGDLALGGTLDVEFNSDTGEIDSIIVSGTLELNGGVISFNDLGSTTLDNGVYVFATYGSLSGEPATEIGVPVNCTVDYAYGGNSIALVAVPEPSALILFVGFGVTLLGRRTRLM